MEQEIKLVVADLDGTLLNEHHQVTNFSCQKIKELTDNGVQFMIATGRHYQDVYLIAQQLNVEMYLITSNGARVHNRSGELIYQNNIPQPFISDILEISAEFNVHRNVYLEDVWLVEEENAPLKAMHHDSGFYYTLASFDHLYQHDILKFYFNAPHEKLLPLEHQLQNALGKHLHITFTTDNYLEVMNKGVSKGHALDMVLKEKEIAPENTIAFGDGLNDTEMLKLVGHPVVMENANPKLKEQLPHAAIAPHHNEDGVIKHLMKHQVFR